MKTKTKEKKKRSDVWIWKMIKEVMKEMKVGDEVGFTIKRTHWILRKGD